MVCFFSLNLLRQFNVLRTDKMSLFDQEYQTVQTYNQLHEGCILLKDGMPIFTNTVAHRLLAKACLNSTTSAEQESSLSSDSDNNERSKRNIRDSTNVIPDFQKEGGVEEALSGVLAEESQ